MRCFNGISLQDQVVPCGQCMACRVNRGRIWSTRILCEQLMHPVRSWFVTLTYDDDNVPVTADHVPNLRRPEFEAWLKSTRRKAGPFRYYAVGEYGDRTLRPHYHMALFPASDRQASRILDCWQLGFTSSTEINAARARYLAQYTTKKLTSADDERLSEGQEPEFRTSSTHPGLGYAIVGPIVARYRTASGRKIIEERGDVERCIRIDAKVHPLGDYLLGKIRAELGIPLLHRERLNHEGYEEWHEIQEAEQDGQKHVTFTEQFHARQRRKEANNSKV